MRLNRTRSTDATFELNLAPFLDIIVSIVPMLLLSIAFVQVKMIEAPTPQVVSQDQVKPDQKPEPTITLKVSKTGGFTFQVVDGSKTQNLKVANKANAFDLDGLLATAIEIKKSHPTIFKLQLTPDGDVAFEDLVKIMDQVRMKPRQVKEQISFTDKDAGKVVNTDMIFPDIVFSSVGG